MEMRRAGGRPESRLGRATRSRCGSGGGGCARSCGRQVHARTHWRGAGAPAPRRRGRHVTRLRLSANPGSSLVGARRGQCAPTPPRGLLGHRGGPCSDRLRLRSCAGRVTTARSLPLPHSHWLGRVPSRTKSQLFCVDSEITNCPCNHLRIRSTDSC